LYQILDNLIRNALKFSVKGRLPDLEVGLRDGPDNYSGSSGQLGEPVFFVRDNGIGISPADQDRIFEPFERLGQHDAQGTGIGLAIVKKIIELYQGKVWVESEAGHGSTFCFTLPLYGEVRRARLAGKGAEA
jgi:chemotaxis family two-component system sensor kinase Cph1